MKILTLLPLVMLPFYIAHAQETRYFEFTVNCGHGNWQDTAFVAGTSDKEVIDSVMANLSRPVEERQFINGAIDYGNGGVNRNASHWFLWHFVPNEWALADFSIEVCDGCPYSDVDADTAYWVGNLGRFCPWTGKPAREVFPVPVDQRPGFGQNEPLFYPNPAQNYITLKFPTGERMAVQLFNTFGQELTKIADAPSQYTMHLSHLRQGVYFLKFTKGDNTITQKLVIRED